MASNRAGVPQTMRVARSPIRLRSHRARHPSQNHQGSCQVHHACITANEPKKPDQKRRPNHDCRSAARAMAAVANARRMKGNHANRVSPRHSAIAALLPTDNANNIPRNHAPCCTVVQGRVKPASTKCAIQAAVPSPMTACRTSNQEGTVKDTRDFVGGWRFVTCAA
jgi:hypothetical protein